MSSDREIELVFVPHRVAAVLAAAIDQHAQQLDVIDIEEGAIWILSFTPMRHCSVLQFGFNDDFRCPTLTPVKQTIYVDPTSQLVFADYQLAIHKNGMCVASFGGAD